MNKIKFRQGDEVIVITGNYKGKTGIIKKVLPKKNQVIIESVAVGKKRVKSANGTEMIEVERPLHVSNVLHLDPKVNMPTKIGYKILEDGRKVRFSKKTGELIS